MTVVPFLSTVGYGSYFKHVLEWWNQRKDANLHFMKYEDVKEVSVLKKNTVSQWEYSPRQRIAASTIERCFVGLLMTILQAATRPIPTPSQMTIHWPSPTSRLPMPSHTMYQVHYYSRHLRAHSASTRIKKILPKKYQIS